MTGVLTVHRTAALAGRRAIVTGGAQGLGRAFALAFAAAGAQVAVCDLRPEVTAVAAEIEARGVRGWAQCADVTAPVAVRSFVAGAAERLGGIDIVVNNAAIMRQTSPTSDSWQKAVDDFEAVIGVNVRGCYLVGRAAIPYLIQQGGDLINITTDHIHTCGYPEAVGHADATGCRWASTRRPPVGGPRYDLYDASKWALKGLTNAWAAALAGHGVRVNSLGMGATDTPMIRAHLAAKGATAPPGMLQPEQVADVLVELIAEGPAGRTSDSIQLWPGHHCSLPPPSLDGTLAGAQLKGASA
jgi:3-oxoacyl-[acyl-carrier protein] reductase